MQITYFAADFVDPALERRVRLLRRGGATINLLGFRRSHQPITHVDGVTTIDLGRTFDGRLGNRLMQVLRRCFDARRWREIIAASDVLLARNLEMATIANAARAWAKSDVRLAYECLDIHATQLGNSIPSRLVRAWEKYILRRSSALILSSPSHLTNYFNRFGTLPDVIFAENKRVLPDLTGRPLCRERHAPWQIGWFGVLRCVKSFELLATLATHHPTRVEIVLRGRPHPPIQSLIDRHLPMANMRYEGPYAQSDLAAIYHACDLTWAIEYAGQNSTNAKWALGNRLYEGGFYNVPSIALAGTAMGDWLNARHTGVVVHDPLMEIGDLLTRLTPSRYLDLQKSAAAIPTDNLVWSTEDCRALVKALMRDRC